jgi:hypothetical protein
MRPISDHRRMYVKPEFVPKNKTVPAHFIVNSEDKDRFIKHLENNGVTVHCPTEYLTQGTGDVLELEVQTGIPPKDGQTLCDSFK